MIVHILKMCTSILCTFYGFLAHLSRKLMGELIVYQSLRRPSVRPQFQTSSPLKPLGQLNSNYIWRLLRTRERKFVQMVLVTECINAFYWHQIFALDSAVVEVQEMFSSHGGHLTNAMYHHGETLLSNYYTMM